MEIWRDIRGYEGAYQVSNKGNVRSLPRMLVDKNGRVVKYAGKMLAQVPNSMGYMRVPLKARGNEMRVFVHRLVASHFVDNPKPDEYTIVNHLDSNPRNNDAENLEWTNLAGNAQHAVKNGRAKRTPEWISHLRKSIEQYQRPVVGFDPDTGKTFFEFDSIQECGRSGYDASCVCECCKGRRKTHKGLAWRYADRG